jgi:putative DNA methylase
MPIENSLILNDFPYVEISKMAEKESWRKEIHRPIYHIHKWWAQRLGSVFRALLIGCYVDNQQDFFKEYYNPGLRNWDINVLDPFMGSGTTVGEAARLRINAIGQDINPIAYQSVKSIFELEEEDKLDAAFLRIQEYAEERIKHFYSTIYKEEECQVLYYFWVKYVLCPDCNEHLYLFDNYIFSKHAYVKKYPKVQNVCPKCFGIFEGEYSNTSVDCPHCNYVFNPHEGAVNGGEVFCIKCKKYHKITQLAKSQNFPYQHRMYAKMLLCSDQSKVYASVNDYDLSLYNDAQAVLKEKGIPIPKISLTNGHNTNQALNYGFTSWEMFFNERQLLAISYIIEAINKLNDKRHKDIFAILLSGVLEFNNMFTSFKGEGTGAVRHMFSNHILKPEKTPLEANIWGTPKSSGAFSTMYKTRILRSIDYIKTPFEIDVNTGEKVNLLNDGLKEVKFTNENYKSQKVQVTCGDSSRLDMADNSVDFVVTDPPFFDNVHYSELADFFLPWHKVLFTEGITSNIYTTRAKGEVQDVNPEQFSSKLEAVFKECCRVLKDDGLLIFSYHQSKDDGWVSLINAIIGGGFSIANCFPVKSEMSVAQPKIQAKSPINTDIIFICRKNKGMEQENEITDIISTATATSKIKFFRMVNAGLALSTNDLKIIAYAETLSQISNSKNWNYLTNRLQSSTEIINRILKDIYKEAYPG